MSWQEKLKEYFNYIEDPDILDDIYQTLMEAETEASDLAMRQLKAGNEKDSHYEGGRANAFFELRKILKLPKEQKQGRMKER